MKITIKGRTFSFLEKEKDTKDEAHVDLSQYVSQRSFSEAVEKVARDTGKTEAQIIEETFHDGWLTWMIEESGGSAQLDVSQMFKKTAGKKDKSIAELIRLRRDFAPVSKCIDYLKSKLIGGGIDVVIDDPKNAKQKELKKELRKLIEAIYQDEYTRTLNIIMPILIDDSLTTGMGAAEITYETNKTFWDYAEVSDKTQTVKVKDKQVDIVSYDVTEPKWKEDLKGIARLKIMAKAHERFEPQRDLKSWEIKYWILDEGKNTNVITLNGVKLRKLIGNKSKAGTYLHPWQLFWLILIRKDGFLKGKSAIRPVLGVSQLLEKILKAVGEGIHRAGNKKFFIVCGTEKRPWSGPHVRNVLQQLREASKKNWSTIPMPRGFSIEEMGGEVFEAKDVVNYFLKLIANGMQVPAKELGVEVREERDYNYTEMKLNLLLSIKHQLFKRHVWCKHGKLRTKQGKGNTEATYIPNAKIKLEDGFLTPEKELELYIKILNPANPIRPPLKLEAEKGMAKLFGWDEIAFPTQEEYEKELKEMEERALKFKRAFAPKGEKEQGEPVPQTEERQKKRLKGMGEAGKGKRGQAKEMGSTRNPREVQETVVIPEIKVQPLEIRIVQESSPDSKIPSPTDKIIMELAKERKALTQKQQEREALEKKLVEEKGEKAKEKLQVEIDNIKLDIETKQTEVERLKAEIKKVESETAEMKKTHEKKREAIDEATEQLKREKEFMGEENGSDV